MTWTNLVRDPFTAQFLLIFVSLAVLVIFHYVFNHLRPVQGERVPTPRAPSSSTVSKPRAPPPPQALASVPLARSANRLFVSYPTISFCCDVLFTESSEQALSEGITILSDVCTILREASNVSKVFLIFHDKSPDGILGAILGSALEAEGLLGQGTGQVPKHRVLSCSTEIGKIAIIRQLEASLHIENSQSVYDELARFKTKQWLVGQPNQPNDLIRTVTEKH
jgi:hypothetical protein